MKRREAEQGAGGGGGVREGGELSWGLILKVYVSEETV